MNFIIRVLEIIRIAEGLVLILCIVPFLNRNIYRREESDIWSK